MLFISISSALNAQQIKLKETGVFTLSLGTGLFGITYFTHQKNKLNTPQKIGVGFNISVGVTLHVISWETKQKTKPKFI